MIDLIIKKRYQEYREIANKNQKRVVPFSQFLKAWEEKNGSSILKPDDYLKPISEKEILSFQSTVVSFLKEFYEPSDVPMPFKDIYFSYNDYVGGRRISVIRFSKESSLIFGKAVRFHVPTLGKTVVGLLCRRKQNVL